MSRWFPLALSFIPIASNGAPSTAGRNGISAFQLGHDVFSESRMKEVGS